ncbi:MAG TPA: helix-turn-helix domain-containing protein [Acidimicrobiales bacterium]
MPAVADDAVSGAAQVTPESLAERSQLMDAALKVMRRNGFQGASVQDILDRAGLSTRAFYRQFQSKDDLLLAMFRTASAADVEEVVRRVGEASTTVDAVRVWIDEVLSIAYDRKRIQRLVMFNAVARQAVGYEAEEASLQDRLVSPLLQAIRRGSADGSFPDTDPFPDAYSIFDLLWSVAGPHVRQRRPMDRERARAHILRFCLPALGTDPGA